MMMKMPVVLMNRLEQASAVWDKEKKSGLLFNENIALYIRGGS